jgi:hypothetical protein
MQPDVLDMLRDDVRAADAQRQRNREHFPTGPAAKSWADEHFPNRPEVRGNSVFHATNAAGESIGTPPDEYVHKLGGTPCEYRPMGDWA